MSQPNEQLAVDDVPKEQQWVLPLLTVLTVLVLGSFLAPNFLRALHRRPYMSCRGNLKNIATALESYATDNQGSYPPTFDRLWPAYLKAAPYCSSAPQLTYHYQASTLNGKSRYLICCAGQHRYYGPFLIYPQVGPGYPQYSSDTD